MHPAPTPDEDAVSPVIGIVLMVAITVVLTTAVGTFVLDLGGESKTAPAPYVNWEFEAHPGSAADFSASDDEITITHAQGDALTEDIGVLIDGERVSDSGGLAFESGADPWGSSFGPGDSVVVEEASGSIEEGDRVLVVYRPDRPELRTVMDQGTVE